MDDGRFVLGHFELGLRKILIDFFLGRLDGCSIDHFFWNLILDSLGLHLILNFLLRNLLGGLRDFDWGFNNRFLDFLLNGLFNLLNGRLDHWFSDLGLWLAANCNLNLRSLHDHGFWLDFYLDWCNRLRFLLRWSEILEVLVLAWLHDHRFRLLKWGICLGLHLLRNHADWYGLLSGGMQIHLCLILGLLTLFGLGHCNFDELRLAHCVGTNRSSLFREE